MKTLIDFFTDKSKISEYLMLVVKYSAMSESEAAKQFDELKKLFDYNVVELGFLSFFVAQANPRLEMNQHLCIASGIVEGKMVDMRLMMNDAWLSYCEYWDSQDHKHTNNASTPLFDRQAKTLQEFDRQAKTLQEFDSIDFQYGELDRDR